ncbi:cytochrome b/b6 domain-containing protein [Melioribacter sp. OK-6-Me]|uniref:cytochrome b/b6 domain-containing protein n=1 Tax=unclassified Melioribacter TaxID=2627329 RepID=UPI003ED9B1B6
MIRRIVLLSACSLLILFNYEINAQDFNCLDCHEISIEKSVHYEAIECQDCHQDVVDEEHAEKGAKKVDCSVCHDDKVASVQTDIHHRLKIKNAPGCVSCHGSHEIKKPSTSLAANSKDYCSKCHEAKPLLTNYHVEKVSKNNCLSCHKKEDVKLTLPTSVHNKLECADCHSFIAQNISKHPKNLKITEIANCYSCHVDIAAQHKESIHGIALSEGIDDAAKCWDCHGSHDIKKVDHPSSPVNSVNISKTCSKCHDNPEIAKKYEIGLVNPGIKYSNSVHGMMVKSGNKGATCTTCHGVHDIKNKVQQGSKISAFNLPETCGQCHEKETKEYLESIHWIRAKKGYRESPVCNDCHNEHDINPISGSNKRLEARKIQQKTCMVCHENPRITERFGINGNKAKSYQDSYHGLAVMRGDKDAAMCVDCHGVHKILPKEHPASTVNVSNVTETCKKCHPDATPVFSQSYSHVTINETAAKVEQIVTDIYFWLIFSVIGGMILHNLLIFLFEIKKKKKRIEKEITIPRFTRSEVVQHFLLLVSFIVLAITGFALKYHTSWWAELLMYFGMTETVRQYIHRGAAVVMIGVGVYHIFYLLFTPRGREVLKNLLPKHTDIIEARDTILYYLRIKKEKPIYDKYDYTEKAEYWALIWGTVIMGTTGFILWFPTVVGDWAPVWLIKVSELIHFYEAILATLAILVWHWFFVIFHPHEYPMSLTWIDGKMTLKNYRHHHEKHFRKVLLEWKEFKAGKREEKKLSNSTLLFTKTLRENNLDPDTIFDKELENDPELRLWLDNKLNTEVNKGEK